MAPNPQAESSFYIYDEPSFTRSTGSASFFGVAEVLKTGQVGWLDRPNGEGTTVRPVVAGEQGARLVLYAGQNQGDPIVSYGPFIGDSKEDIVRLFTEYQTGQFVRMSNLARQKT